MSQKKEKLTNQLTKELHDAFNLFDRDKSGTISSSELKEVLIALNFQPTDGLLRSVMKKMDTDGNGTIEFDEFAKVMRSVYERKFTDEEMRRAFECFDTDDSGFITINELRKVLSRLNPNITDQRIIDVLNKVDVNHDGKISYEEFVHMLDEI